MIHNRHRRFVSVDILSMDPYEETDLHHALAAAVVGSPLYKEIFPQEDKRDPSTIVTSNPFLEVFNAGKEKRGDINKDPVETLNYFSVELDSLPFIIIDYLNDLSDSFDSLEYINEIIVKIRSITDIDTAIKTRSFHLMRWALIHRKMAWSRNSCTLAAEIEDLQMLEMLYERRCPWDNRTSLAAARTGNIDLFEWLLKRKCPWEFCDTIRCVLENNRPDLFKWIVGRCKIIDKRWLFGETMWFGNIGLMDWLYKDNYDLDVFTMESAIRSQRTNVVEWLHKKSCPVSESVCQVAAKEGFNDILKFLLSNGYKVSIQYCLAAAASRKDKSMMEWLCENHEPWDPGAFVLLLGITDDVSILKWVHEEGYSWDSRTFNAAVIKGKMDLLEFLYEQQCPWDSTTFDDAVCSRDDTVIKWLHEKKCPWNKETFLKQMEDDPHYSQEYKMFMAEAVSQLPF